MRSDTPKISEKVDSVDKTLAERIESCPEILDEFLSETGQYNFIATVRLAAKDNPRLYASVFSINHPGRESGGTPFKAAQAIQSDVQLAFEKGKTSEDLGQVNNTVLWQYLINGYDSQSKVNPEDRNYSYDGFMENSMPDTLLSEVYMSNLRLVYLKGRQHAQDKGNKRSGKKGFFRTLFNHVKIPLVTLALMAAAYPFAVRDIYDRTEESVGGYVSTIKDDAKTEITGVITEKETEYRKQAEEYVTYAQKHGPDWLVEQLKNPKVSDAVGESVVAYQQKKPDAFNNPERLKEGILLALQDEKVQKALYNPEQMSTAFKQAFDDPAFQKKLEDLIAKNNPLAGLFGKPKDK